MSTKPGQRPSLMGMVKSLKGLQETKHFGAKRRSRHKDAKRHALQKARGEMPF